MCDRRERVKGLVLTVGGTPEPIVFTIRSLRPAHVALVCSEDSLATATAVKASLQQPDGTGPEPAVRTFRTDDETDPVSYTHLTLPTTPYV